MPTVRLATVADAADVHAVLLAAFEPLRERYTPGAFDATVLDPPRVVARIGEGPVWVAESEDRVIGTFSAIVDERGCYLRGMGVDPRVRGRGAGAALLAAALEYAAAGTRTWLYTTEFLHAAIRLYERAGFHRFDEDPPADLHGTPLIGMERLA